LYGDWDFFARICKLHPAAFIPYETTLNRSHFDEVRITKMPELNQLERRLELIDRVWEKDSDFVIENKNSIEKIKSKIFLDLVKHYILINKVNQANLYLRKINKKNIYNKIFYMFSRILLKIPLSGKILNIVLLLKSKIT